MYSWWIFDVVPKRNIFEKKKKEEKKSTERLKKVSLFMFPKQEIAHDLNTEKAALLRGGISSKIKRKDEFNQEVHNNSWNSSKKYV